MPCPEKCRHWAGSQKSCAPWALVAQDPGCLWAQGMSEKREGSHWHSPRWVLVDCLQVRGAHWCLKRGLGRHPPWFWGMKDHCPQSMASLCLLCPVSLSPAEGWSHQICCTLLSAWPGDWSHSELPPGKRGKEHCLGERRRMQREGQTLELRPRDMEKRPEGSGKN